MMAHIPEHLNLVVFLVALATEVNLSAELVVQVELFQVELFQVELFQVELFQVELFQVELFQVEQLVVV
jgi:hypothetical protein